MSCIWHTRAIGCCISAVLAGGLAACSTHPLPQDVAGVSTVDIVKSIRCEARAGIEAAAAGLKREDVAKLAPIVKATVIGYDFNLKMEEAGTAGTFDPKKPLLAFAGPNSFSGTLDAQVGHLRKNRRTFTIIEPLAELTRPDNVEVCRDRRKGPNWSSPISGTIGLDEVVRTFLKLELLTELQQQKDKETSKAQKAFSGSHVVFSDELVFTTTYSAKATGELVLDAVVGRVSLTNVAVGADASRTDLHSLIVALTRDPPRGRRPSGGGGSGGGGGSHHSHMSGPKMTAAQERDRMIANGSVRDPRAQARLIQMNASAHDSAAVELQQRRARKDEDNDAARALGQRLLDLLRVP
jgi:hypothetical protein